MGNVTLLTMMEVVLKIRMPDNWVKDVGKRFDGPIRFIECMPHGAEGGRGLIEIDSTEDKTNEIIEAIREHPDVCRVDISPLRDGGVLGSVITNKCMACKALTDSDCFLLSAHGIEGGEVEWHLITGGDGSLANLLAKLESYGCEIDLKSQKRLNKRTMLTQRQEEIVRFAFERGYYDFPKKITIRKLAKAFDVSPSTLTEILQRGEKKIVREHFHKK